MWTQAQLLHQTEPASPSPSSHCSSNSQLRFLRHPQFHTMYHSGHTLTLVMKVSVIPVDRGKSWRGIPGLLTCSYKSPGARLPRRRHATAAGSAARGDGSRDGLRLQAPTDPHGIRKALRKVCLRVSPETQWTTFSFV